MPIWRSVTPFLLPTINYSHFSILLDVPSGGYKVLKWKKKKKIRRQAILWCLEGLFPFHPFSTQTLWLKIEVQFFYLDGLQGGWRENFTSIGLHWWWKLHSETVCSALKAQQPFPVCLPLCVLFLCKTFSLPETPVHQQHLPLFILLFAI